MSNPFPPYWWGEGFNPPIGSSFDEAISYQQQMRKLYKDFHDTVEWLKGELEALIPKIEASTQKFVAEVIDKLEKEIDKKFAMMGADIKANSNKIQILKEDLLNFSEITLGQIDELRELTTEFNNRIASMESEWLKFKGFIEQRYRQLESQLRNEIKDSISYANGDAILVTNPVSSSRDTLKRTLNAIYSMENPYPLYASSLNRYQILGIEWNKLQFKAKELNEMGGLILLQWWSRQGQLDYLQEIVVNSANTAEKASQDVRNLVPIVEENTSTVQGYEDRLKAVEKSNADTDSYAKAQVARLDNDIQINTNNIYDNTNEIRTIQSGLQGEISARTNLLQRFEQLLSYGLKALWHNIDFRIVTIGPQSIKLVIKVPEILKDVPVLAQVSWIYGDGNGSIPSNVFVAGTLSRQPQKLLNLNPNLHEMYAIGTVVFSSELSENAIRVDFSNTIGTDYINNRFTVKAINTGIINAEI